MTASPPAPCRMAIILDGTWQTDKGDKPPTNVVQLRDLILAEDKADGRTIPQRIYYDSGVGTGATADRRRVLPYWDGLTGNGLEDIVRGAYRALCHRYEKGMEIYVFGFSRGAFSARSLVGYINAAGLLRAENCSVSQERKAWEFYRKPPRYRIPAEKRELNKLCWTDTPRIKCLGVFDTVGARGIPSVFFYKRNEARYGFHDTSLSSIVDYAFHALALDEKRGNFPPTLWSYAFHNNNTRIEQVWFPGCHSDVGGGVGSQVYSSLPLYWMVSRIIDEKLGLALNEAAVKKLKEKPAKLREDLTRPFKSNRGLFYRLMSWRPFHRMVNHTSSNRHSKRFIGLPEHLRPMNEAVHWSVFERMKALAQDYEPENIVHDNFWPSVFADTPETATKIVGEMETFLDLLKSDDDRKAVRNTLPESQWKPFDEALNTWQEKPQAG